LVDHIDFIEVDTLLFIYAPAVKDNKNYTILVAKLYCIAEQIYKYLLNSIDVYIVLSFSAVEIELQIDVFDFSLGLDDTNCLFNDILQVGSLDI
jgi:hypothetical protein